MTVENPETGLVKNRQLRNFDAALEASGLFNIVVSDADTSEVCATAWKEGAEKEARRLAAKHGFEPRVEEDEVYGRRVHFTPREMEF